MDEKPKSSENRPRPATDFAETVAERLRPVADPLKQMGTEPTEVAEVSADGTVQASSGESQEMTEEVDHFIGRVLASRYRLIRRLGTGGFGAVFEAEDRKIHKRVAVKVLTRDLVSDRAIVTRFRQEAESASKVGHENIVDITDFDNTEDGHYFMVMEYLEGVDLGQIIRSKQPLALARILSIMIQICRALHATHKKGVLHRDLKPGNIFLTARGSRADFVKLLDFGISKFMEVGEEDSRLTKTGQIIGTPLYMAPEQAKGQEQMDHRVDIYSLGVIMYELITGQPPFTAVNYLGIIARHASEPPVPPSLQRPDLDLPSSVEAIILKALAKKPADRFASMEQMEQALVQSLSDIDPAAAVSYSPDMTPHSLMASQTDLSKRPARSVWWLPIMVILGMVLIGVGIVVITDRKPPQKVRKVVSVERGKRRVISAPDHGIDSISQQVTLRISSRPSGATVLDGQGKEVGETPLELVTSRSDHPLTYTIKRAGYKSASLILVPTEDRSSEVLLKKRISRGQLPDDPKGWGQQ